MGFIAFPPLFDLIVRLSTFFDVLSPSLSTVALLFTPAAFPCLCSFLRTFLKALLTELSTKAFTLGVAFHSLFERNDRCRSTSGAKMASLLVKHDFFDGPTEPKSETPLGVLLLPLASFSAMFLLILRQ